ncbi:MAG: hypothetical protein KDD50_12385 [Bdellovibrionales bacterium]|nr:hypothetical protein [Bdellovibrionales bacterium]
MKKIIISLMFLTLPYQAKADLWGADLPLLAEIVFNTLHTMYELQQQTQHLNDELAGINDKIHRIKTIADLVQPSSWNQWKDPQEAIRRLRLIYYTMPKEYHSKKSDAIEAEISNAMNVISRISGEAHSSFLSGKELERRGADASPGVAQKLTASGVGTLVSLEAQSQVLQSHITSLLSQMLAQANEKESRAVVAKGKSYKNISNDLTHQDRTFSDIVIEKRMF